MHPVTVITPVPVADAFLLITIAVALVIDEIVVLAGTPVPVIVAPIGRSLALLEFMPVMPVTLGLLVDERVPVKVVEHP